MVRSDTCGQPRLTPLRNYYGHYYGALRIADLPESQRGLFQAHMAKTIIPKQEKDGSWWDYPLYDYHQPYGTGFALMTLVRCRR